MEGARLSRRDRDASIPDAAPDKDCRRALELGVQLLSDSVATETYKLISGENLIGSPDGGPSVWRLTFKPKRLIPATSNERVGAGGELFVKVDLATGQAELLGYGE